MLHLLGACFSDALVTVQDLILRSELRAYLTIPPVFYQDQHWGSNSWTRPREVHRSACSAAEDHVDPDAYRRKTVTRPHTANLIACDLSEEDLRGLEIAWTARIEASKAHSYMAWEAILPLAVIQRWVDIKGASEVLLNTRSSPDFFPESNFALSYMIEIGRYERDGTENV